MNSKQSIQHMFFSLRGNHEDERMNRHYGFFQELEYDDTFLMRMHRIFETMPVAAVIDNSVFCVHGGLPGAFRIDTITKEDSYQYLWNDPSDENGITESGRGFSINNFGPNIVNEFLSKNNLTEIIRAHQFLEDGYQWWFDRKLLSLFSSTNYCGKRNTGAFVEYKDKKLKLYQFNCEVQTY